MDIERYRLQKKWWQSSGKYVITDDAGRVVFHSLPLGVFKVGIRLFNEDRTRELMRVRATSMWNKDFEICEGDMVIGNISKPSAFSSSKFRLRDQESDLLIETKRWGKQMNFSQGADDVAHVSASSSVWTNIGIVVNRGADARKIISTVILIAYLKSNGYG